MYLNHRLEEIRKAEVYGVRPERTFSEAAIKFVEENEHKRSLRSDIGRLRGLMPQLGSTPLNRVNMTTLQPWIQMRKAEGVAVGTVNHGLKLVRRIQNLAASEWVDEFGLTWLEAPPKISLLPDKNKRAPYPLSWSEQDQLFQALPEHLAAMALFAVNTGCRDQEVCRLQWDWEQPLPGLRAPVFVIPGRLVKNGDDRLVVLNRAANSVVESMRGRHPTHVFSYRGHPVTRMLNSAWCRVRREIGLNHIRVHDLKHTFGQRLRAAGVGFEDRQDLLGHRSNRITTHYSAAEVSKLEEAANKVCDRAGTRPELAVVRKAR